MINHKQVIAKNLEIIRIQNIEIASLKSSKEVVKRDIQDSLTSLKDIRSRAEEVSEQIKENGDILLNLADLIKETVKIGRKAISEAQDVLNDSAKMVSDMNKEMKSQAEVLEQTKKDALEIHKQVLEEQEKISKNKEDLDIYKSRLERAYKENMPEHKIIL